MARIVTATEARIHFGEMMKDVIDLNETIVVSRSGQPAVVMMSLDRYEQLRAGGESAESWLTPLLQFRRRLKEELGERRLENASEVIRQMREERDAELLDLR